MCAKPSLQPGSRAEAWASRAVFALALAALALGSTQLSIKIAGIFISPADPLVWLACGLLALQALAARAWRSVRLPPLPAWLLIGAACLSVARAGNRLEAVKEIAQWAEYFLAAVAVFAAVLASEHRRRAAVFALLGIAAAVTAIAAAQYAGPAVDPFRVRGLFGNRNILGGYLALVLPIAFSLAILPGARPGLRVALGVLAAAGSAVALAGGTLIALAVGFIGAALARGRLAFTAVLVALALGAGFALPSLPRDNVATAAESIDLFNAEGTISPRITEWHAAWNMWKEQPLLGVGIGNYQLNIGRYYGYVERPNRNVTEPDSHNLYLVIGSTVGLLGLLAYLGLLLDAIGRAARAPAGDAFARALGVGICWGLVAFMLNGIWAGLVVRGLGLPLAFVLALAGSLAAPGRAAPGRPVSGPD